MPSSASNQPIHTMTDHPPAVAVTEAAAASVSVASLPVFKPMPRAPKGPNFSQLFACNPTFFNASTLTAAAPPAPNSAATAVNTCPASPPLKFGPSGLVLPDLFVMESSLKPISPLQAFTQLKVPVYFRCNRPHQQIIDEQFTIYSLATLHILLAEMKKNKEQPVLRFLVDKNMHIWFAREKSDKIPSPAHFKMTGAPSGTAQSVATGNLFLAADFSTLVKFNNKSGDFEPSFDSLKWFIAILLLNKGRLPFVIPPTIEVEMFHNKALTQQLVWRLTDIKSMLAQRFSPTNPGALQQPALKAKTVTYLKNKDLEIPIKGKIAVEPPTFSPK